MTSREERQQRCEAQIRRNGCFHLVMREREEAWVDRAAALAQHEAAFEECFLPILRIGDRCGVFGARSGELLRGEAGWDQVEAGGLWKTFAGDYLSARACWTADRISLEVSILVPLRLDYSIAVETAENVIRTCYDPGTVSNPTAIVTEDAFRFARTNARKGDVLWSAFRSAPTNLYLTFLGKPEVVRRWFRFAIDNAQGDWWADRV